MEQIMIYDYLGSNDDPVYEKLSKLKNGESFVMDGLNVSHNEFGLYEIATENTHDCYGNMTECYDSVCELLKDQLLIV
jgi:hypothetical protein